MSQTYYVYALLDSGESGPFQYGHRKFTFQPFYIGKGKNHRHVHHEETAFKRKNGNYVSHTHKSRKIRKIYREGNQVLCKVIAKELSESEAFDLEKSLIEKIGRSDLDEGPLTNKTDGGEGTTRLKVKKCTRDLHSLAARLQQLNLSEQERKEIKAKISASVKAYSASLPRSEIDKRIAKMVKTNKSKSVRQKNQTNNKRSETCKAYHANRTPEQDKVITEARLKAWAARRANKNLVNGYRAQK
jgi:hypothetical protein